MENNYRLDIQGLRALAVLLVFFAHADWPLFSGGFIGVDVFFVISGYVITLLLLTEFNDNNTIVWHKFYARRLQRLLPALVFMILIISLISLIIIIPKEQLSQYGAAKSAAVWLSNMFFINSDINYFSTSASENLYLHTWSLGVEEQFYLLWPILMLIGLKYFNKVKKNLFGLMVFLILVISVSVLTHVLFTIYASKYAFYLMPTRAWQFGLGALIAVLHFKKKKSTCGKYSSFVTEFSSISGITMIFFSAILFSNYTPYPNWQVVIPSIGTALILFQNPYKEYSSIGKVLTFKPLVFVGNISYSFYLWHWPILLLNKKLVLYFPFFNTIFSLALILIMSLLTYYFIEQPIRKSKTLRSNPKPLIIGFLTVMLLLILFLFALQSFSRILSNDKEQQNISLAKSKLPIIYQQGCNDWYNSDTVKKCEFGDKSSNNKVVIFGDSILFQWFPAMLNYYKEQRWHVIVFIKIGCPMINRPFFYYRIRSVYSICDSWRKSVIQEIKEISPQTLIIGNSTGYPFSKKDWQNGTSEIIDELLPYTKTIKLFAGTPKLRFDGPLCVSRKSWLSKMFSGILESSCSQKLSPNKTWKWQNELASEYSNVQFIETSKSVCPNQLCQAERNGRLIYRDSMHLSVDFVISLQNIINEELSKE